MTPRAAMPYAIGVDVGGTSIRCGLVNARGSVRRGSYRASAVASKGSAEEILKSFATEIGACLSQAKQAELNLKGIGIGMCGPLDYEKGIVLMQGLDKYESLYGMNLKNALRERLNLPNDFPIVMEPDSWAFARGEDWLGAGKDYRRVLVVTLGTGFGSAFVADGKLLGDGPGIPPPFGWLGSLPFRNGILDDVVSRRGILSLYESLATSPVPQAWDVLDIVNGAREGDLVCRQVFEGFGHFLGSALGPVIRQFEAECLIFGGRISQAFDLFGESLICGLEEPPSLLKITIGRMGSLPALQGAARLVFVSA